MGSLEESLDHAKLMKAPQKRGVSQGYKNEDSGN